MRKGFSNLRDYVGEVDRYYLFKDGQTVTISDLPDENSRPSNALNHEDGTEGFNPPARHSEPIGSASLNVTNFTLGRRSKHKKFNFEGLFVDVDYEILMDHEYIHKNFLHEGQGSAVELGDCPLPIADEHGTVGCLSIVGQGAPIFFPEWDKTFPIDVLADNNKLDQLNVTFWNGGGIDSCNERAEKGRTSLLRQGATHAVAQKVFDDTFAACRNVESENLDQLREKYPDAAFDEFTTTFGASRSIFTSICGCTETEKRSDMVWNVHNCGWEMLLNEEDVRTLPDNLPIYSSARYSDEVWFDLWDEEAVARQFSESQQTTDDLSDFNPF